jgi:hypothetical protein
MTEDNVKTGLPQLPESFDASMMEHQSAFPEAEGLFEKAHQADIREAVNRLLEERAAYIASGKWLH